MKFGEHLALVISHTPDWRQRFIHYGELKHIIHCIRHALSTEVAAQGADESSFLLIRQRTGTPHTTGRESLTIFGEGDESDSERGEPTPILAYEDAVQLFKDEIHCNCMMVWSFFQDTAIKYQEYLQHHYEQNLIKGIHQYKHSVVHLYRRLDSLRVFLSTNKLAVKKIIKKFNKNVKAPDRISMAAYTNHWTSRDVDELAEEVEELFAEAYYGGNVVKARKQLRTHALFKFSHTDAFYFGVFAGWIVPALIFLRSNMSTFTEDHMRLWVLPYIPIYRMMALCILAVWGWGACLLCYERAAINHAYILGLNPARCLSWVEAFQVAAAMTVVWIIAAGSHFLTVPMLGLPHHGIPIVLLGLALGLLFFPFRGFHWRTRASLVRKLGHIVRLPFGPVAFGEFFLADQLTSMSTAIADAFYTVCFYCTAPWNGETRTAKVLWCYQFTTGNKFFALGVPHLWRVAQCLRMHRATRNRLHLVNTGKYCGFLMVVACGYGWTHHATPRWALVAVSVAAECYALAWDVLMDWGFIKGPSRQRLYPGLAVYFAIVLFDAVGRFMFLTTKSQGAVVPLMLTEAVLICVLAPLEVVRRNLWNILRLENEMVNNLESYRSIDYVPTPIAELHLADEFAAA